MTDINRSGLRKIGIGLFLSRSEDVARTEVINN